MKKFEARLRMKTGGKRLGMFEGDDGENKAKAICHAQSLRRGWSTVVVIHTVEGEFLISGFGDSYVVTRA